MQEDKVFMEGYKSGDHESFEKLVLKYRSNAINFACRYINDTYQAEDMVQEAFAYTYVYRDRYKEEYSFKTYLFSIIKHKCIDCLRKRHSISSDASNLRSQSNPEEEYLHNEQVGILKRKVNELKYDYRTVIYLIEYEEFSYQETARIMGRTLGQIKILVYRARKKLKQLIEKEG